MITLILFMVCICCQNMRSLAQLRNSHSENQRLLYRFGSRSNLIFHVERALNFERCSFFSLSLRFLDTGLVNIQRKNKGQMGIVNALVITMTSIGRFRSAVIARPKSDSSWDESEEFSFRRVYISYLSQV